MLRPLMVFALVALMGCAPPSTLTPERSAEIKKLGVITSIPDNNLKALDHRPRNIPNTITYGQFGAIGALMESVILLGIREHTASSKSVSGDLTDKRLSSVNLTLKNDIDSALIQKLSKKYPIVEPQYFDVKKLSLKNKSECFAESKRIGIDTLAFIDIAYGLATYNDKEASVSIDAEMVVYDVEKEEVILKKLIESDQDFREHRTAKEFANQNSKLLIEDINDAINGFSSYVARQLGIWQ